MNCKICGSDTQKIFTKKVLLKYDAAYYKCTSCSFVQTSEPHWLPEAYSSAITALDVGLVNRNIQLQEETSDVIDACFPVARSFLDYAGGYGMFVRMMRDAGYDFYRQDIYCENLFAKHFDITDTDYKKFDVLTAFEVFEHFEDPMSEIGKIFSLSDNIIFSTKLLPARDTEISDWWYIAPETGQHIAFYDKKTLQYIAEKNGKKYFFNGKNLHVFTSEEIPADRIDFAFGGVREKKTFLGLQTTVVDFRIPRESLLQRDFDYIKGLITTPKPKG